MKKVTVTVTQEDVCSRTVHERFVELLEINSGAGVMACLLHIAQDMGLDLSTMAKAAAEIAQENQEGGAS